MTDRTLFPDDRPDNLPHNHTATSKLAAESMRPFAAPQLMRVFRFLESRSDRGATDEEQQDALNMSGNSQRPRRKRLVELGRVKDSENLRMTRSGRPAAVWIVSSPDHPPAVASTTNWPTNGKSNPNKGNSADFVPDFSI